VSRPDSERIADAKAHLAALRAHLAQDGLDNATVFDAVCMRLSAAIESVAAIDEHLRDEEFGRLWPAVWSVRNRIAHGYIFADRAIIQSTVEHDLIGFEESLDRLAQALNGPLQPPDGHEPK